MNPDPPVIPSKIADLIERICYEFENTGDSLREVIARNISQFTKRPRKTLLADKNPQFTAFWAAHPKKRCKGQAEKAWNTLNPNADLFEKIMAGLERAKASPDWHKADERGVIGAFIPYPATWLRAKGWEDSYEVDLSIKPVKNKPNLCGIPGCERPWVMVEGTKRRCSVHAEPVGGEGPPVQPTDQAPA